MTPTISIPFLTSACDILGDTNEGLSGLIIVKQLSAFAAEYNVEIPHCEYPFEAPNKRTALLENLKCFDSIQQYHILSRLCNEERQTQREKVQNFYKELRFRYGQLDNEGANFDQSLTSDTKHWLGKYPRALKSYNEALDKRKRGVYDRNLLDDLRLSFELLLKDVLNNKKSIENQKSELAEFINKIGGAKEFMNMFVKLIDYYCKYQNEHVKHNDCVVELEVDFIVDLTSAMMKFICRCK